MSYVEGRRLAEWSQAVRESTLKRLRRVPRNMFDWRPVSEALSFADIAHHLAVCDRWLFSKLENPALMGIKGQVGEAALLISQFSTILDDLADLGERRRLFLSHLDERALNRLLPDDRFGGEVSAWWVIVRGNLDHEVHHRGQIAVYLRQLSLQG